MTIVEALIKCAQKIRNILLGAGLIEGESLEQIDNVDEILFWHSLAKNGGGNKDTYVVWNVMPPTPVINADNSSKLWRCSAYIDLFTRYNITYLAVQERLTIINLEAIKNRWDVSLNEAPSYEPEFKRTRFTIQVTKILHKGEN